MLAIAVTMFLVAMAGVQAVRAMTGSSAVANWFVYGLMVCVVAPGFCAFLIVSDRAYRICWNDRELRMRLPGVTWRFRLQPELTVSFSSMLLVEPEHTPVMPALRNILIWYEEGGRHANLPLSPALLSKSDLRSVLLAINEHSPARVDERVASMVAE